MTPASEIRRVYRAVVNGHGSPSEIVSRGYRWVPGTELAGRADVEIPEIEETG